MEKERYYKNETREVVGTNPELIPEVEGLVFKEKGYYLSAEEFSPLVLQPTTPKDFLRPIVIETGESENSPLKCKSIYSSAKSCFIEKLITIDNTDYNFLQWKGVGNTNAAIASLPHLTDKIEKIGNPLQQNTHFPIFRATVGEMDITLKTGAAYYDDLRKEAERSTYLERIGLRIPRVLATFKFSKSFAQKEGIPIPHNDDPEDLEGETIEQFEKRLQDAGASEDIHLAEEGVGILGQELRAFRNLYRFLDLSEIMKIENLVERERKASAIIIASKEILTKELGQEFTNLDFLEKCSELLAIQGSILVKEKIVHGGVHRFNQDITLAAEIADWDSADFLSELSEEKQKELEPKLYQQLFLLCGYLKSLAESIETIEKNKIDNAKIIETFFNTLQTTLSQDELYRLQEILEQHPEITDIQSLALKGSTWEQDFIKYQEYASLLSERCRQGKT